MTSRYPPENIIQGFSQKQKSAAGETSKESGWLMQKKNLLEQAFISIFPFVITSQRHFLKHSSL